MRRTIKKALQIGCGLCVLVIVVVVLLVWYYVRHAPHAWKEKAIAEINQHYNSPAWLALNNRACLPPPRDHPDSVLPWATNHYMLMQNGEWLVYTHSVCHENLIINDHFIARASNGKWYYSSYHFCRALIGLSMTYPTRPRSLADFTWACGLVEFDGMSDVCLEKTTSPDANYVWTGQLLPPSGIQIHGPEQYDENAPVIPGSPSSLSRLSVTPESAHVPDH